MLDHAIGPNVIKRLNEGFKTFLEKHGFGIHSRISGDHAATALVLQSQIQTTERFGLCRWVRERRRVRRAEHRIRPTQAISMKWLPAIRPPQQPSSKSACEAAPERMPPPTDHKPRPYDGPSRDEVLAMRKQFANPAIFTLYKEPLMIVEGHMQWLFDETGKRYLDMFAGIVTVSCGHCHPRVTKAIHEQVDRFSTRRRSICIRTCRRSRRSSRRRCRRVSTSRTS